MIGTALATPKDVHSADTLADALAVLLVDLVSVLPSGNRTVTLERLVNRLDDRGRTPDGTEAATLLGKVAGTLMRMGL